MSKVQVDTIDTRSGTSTMQIGSTNTSTINIGVSGDTVNIPSGVTIANAGTATGFGETNTPAFAVRLGSNQTLSNNTLTKITLDTEDYDTDNAFASNKFTVPSGKAGKYKITLNVYWSFGNNESASEIQTHLYKNGSSVQREWISFNPTGRMSGAAQTLTMDLSLAVSDYIELYALGYTGGASITVVDTQTRMQGFRISS